MTDQRRFGRSFLDAVVRSPAVAIGGLSVTVGPLIASAVVWLVGLPAWTVFLLAVVAVPVPALVVDHLASLASE